ncbi:MAG TPA: SDR family NAD(P)-dependent oxidoreductase [Candidatus Angelobacter sp.]|nr:SDR family NAD(P)-dependent oxidoreductase [Candidatus Angelobacter sp.]
MPSSPAAASEIGGECLAVSADVSSAKGTEKLVSAAIEKFKRINILVNNAAVLLPGGRKLRHNKQRDGGRDREPVEKAVSFQQR